MIFLTEDKRQIEINSSLDNEMMAEAMIAIEDLSNEYRNDQAIWISAVDALLFAKYLEIEAERILRIND